MRNEKRNRQAWAEACFAATGCTAVSIFNTLSKTVNSNAVRVLKAKLPNQTMEVTVTLLPQEHALQVSYKVINADKSIVQTGTLTVPISIQPVKAGLYQSVKKKMGLYLQQYDAAMTVMGRKLVDKLATAL